LEIGEAILIENGKQHFVKYDSEGNEVFEERNRCFNGIRLNLLGS
jgi:hypothetical protein